MSDKDDRTSDSKPAPPDESDIAQVPAAGWVDTGDFEVSVTDPHIRDVKKGADQALGERRAFLILVTGDTPGKRYPLGQAATIGRSSRASIRIKATEVSRLHARISRQPDDTYQIEDLDSHNGTWVNGQEVKQAQLADGDRIEVGTQHVLRFSWTSEAEEKWLEARKMESLGRLAGGIAHDFNNLLMTIMGNIELLQLVTDEQGLKTSMVQECFADLRLATTQSAELVKQLLGFARRSHWEERPIDLSHLLGELSSLMRRTFDRRVDVVTDVEPGLVVVGDGTQLHQMILNLCINSRDAMPEGGKLVISARRHSRSSWVDLEVRDNGQGMPADVAQHIFEPFYTTKEGGRGTGLGLAVVYGVVTGHGGRIAVESEPGSGTTVSIQLPLSTRLPSSADLAITDVHIRTELVPDIQTQTLLVVEDELMVQQSMCRSLEHLGFEVLAASDGVEALDIYRRQGGQIDVVLLDLIMPNKGGEQTLRELKELDPDALVIVMSGYHDQVTLETLRRDGAATFLPKPFSTTDLATVIQTVLRAAHSRRAP